MKTLTNLVVQCACGKKGYCEVDYGNPEKMHPIGLKNGVHVFACTACMCEGHEEEERS